VVSHAVTARGPPAGKPRPNAEHAAKPGGGLINVNTATAAELEALPGIGPVIARWIVDGRPYRSVDELDRVNGIGKKRLEVIRPFIKARRSRPVGITSLWSNGGTKTFGGSPPYGMERSSRWWRSQRIGTLASVRRAEANIR